MNSYRKFDTREIIHTLKFFISKKKYDGQLTDAFEDLKEALSSGRISEKDAQTLMTILSVAKDSVAESRRKYDFIRDHYSEYVHDHRLNDVRNNLKNIQQLIPRICSRMPAPIQSSDPEIVEDSIWCHRKMNSIYTRITDTIKMM